MEGVESLKNLFLVFSQIREEFTSRKSGHKTENKMRALKVSKMAEMRGEKSQEILVSLDLLI